MLEGLKKFAGEIIGIILITVALSKSKILRNLFKKYKELLKKDDSYGTDIKQALDKIQNSLTHSVRRE